MPMLKPALCAAALVIAAAVAIPAIAQQQNDNSPAPQAGRDGHGPDWRGGPRDRSSNEDGPRWRRWHGWRQFGRRDGDDERGMRGRRFGEHVGGRGMRGRGMMARLCGPNGDRVGERLMDRLERVTQPTADQRPNFDKLKEAAGKAHDIMRTACPAERAATPTGRLANTEKRLSAMLDAVRALRPAMDTYYGSLTDEQKARLAMAQPRMMRPGMMGPNMDGSRGDGRRSRDRRDERQQDDRTENTPQQQPAGNTL